MKTSKSASFFDRPVEAEIEFFIDNNLNIVQRIYDALDELGWTSKDLAKKVGVKRRRNLQLAVGVSRFEFKADQQNGGRDGEAGFGGVTKIKRGRQ